MAPGLQVAVARQQDAISQSDVVNASITAKAVFTQSGNYGPHFLNQIENSEPELTFVTGPSTGGHVVSVDATGQNLVLAELSASGTCWYGSDNETPATVAGRPSGISYAKSSGGPCDASTPPATMTWSKKMPAAG